MKIINKSSLQALLDKLAQQTEVYVPMGRGNTSGFYSWKSYDEKSDQLMLDSLNVYISPKSLVFPQTEKMYSLKQAGQDVSIDETYEDHSAAIIFGVRACDARAITALDEVFLTRGYEDSFYKAKRENVTIIGNACYKPGSNCFCGFMEIDPANPDADVIIRDAGDAYIWEAKTEKGEKLTAGIADLLQEKELPLPELQAFKLDASAYEGLAEKLKGMFDHPIWHELSEACQNCGVCTYVCPSCHCFDIQVKMYGNEGYRFRCWDSCMYTEYSAEAGGGNPRSNPTERFRNRFLHKLEFFKERYGHPLCTGCGRCIVACPTGINIVNIINQLKEADADV